MYHYIEDKEFLKNMRRICSNIINQLVQAINRDNLMKVNFQLVGSGARHLETQNSNNPVDLDYNVNILDISFDINDCKRIKEYIRKTFNKILKSNNWGDCNDSTSVLSTEYRYFTSGNNTRFKIDLGIVVEDNERWHRLIHQKTGIIDNDSWIWNESPNSKNLDKKVKFIKNNHYWDDVIVTYLDKKNIYLTRNDHNHPSFNCYIETINEVYKKYGGK